MSQHNILEWLNCLATFSERTFISFATIAFCCGYFCSRRRTLTSNQRNHRHKQGNNTEKKLPDMQISLETCQHLQRNNAENGPSSSDYLPEIFNTGYQQDETSKHLFSDIAGNRDHVTCLFYSY